MSHFNVAIITKGKPTEEEISDILAPYQENNMGDVPEEYLEFVPIDKDEFEDYEAEYHKQIWENCESRTFQEYMEDQGYTYNENTDEYGCYYNTNARWDWWVIGGRWCGELIIPVNCDAEFGEKSWTNEESNPYTYQNNMYKKCDCARVKDLAFPDKQETWCESARFWELYIEGVEPQNDKDRKLVEEGMFYRKEYFLEHYKTKDRYATYMSSFVAHALITKDGEWHERGEMGWFGVTRNEEDPLTWAECFTRAVFEDADDDDYITIVDCHI